MLISQTLKKRYPKVPVFECKMSFSKELRFWEDVRDIFKEVFQFWPDGEDLIWAKSMWNLLLDAGFYAPQTEDGEAWTLQHIMALGFLYAESATRFGVEYTKRPSYFARQWRLIHFGSVKNLDEVLENVGQAVSISPIGDPFDGEPEFLIPLIRSLVTGSGFYVTGPELDDYLAKVVERDFDLCRFREDRLRSMWWGGHFTSEQMECLP